MRLLPVGVAILGLAVAVSIRDSFAPVQRAEDTGASLPSARTRAIPTPPETTTAPARSVTAREPSHGISGPAAVARNNAVDAARPPSRAIATVATTTRLEQPPAARERRPSPAMAFATLLESGEFTDTMGPIARLYLAYFNRLPDYEGFQWYIDRRDEGTALDFIADEFAGSREFGTKYGDVDNAGFLDRMASNVFEGGLDPAQRAHWLAQLDSGAMTRGQVMLALSESGAFRAATDNEVFVAIAYAETLQRAPRLEDWDRWVAFLDAGHPRSDLIAELLRAR
jgi:hypothetical protein